VNLAEVLDTALKEFKPKPFPRFITPLKQTMEGVHKNFRYRIDDDTGRTFWAMFSVPDEKGKPTQYGFNAFKKPKMEGTWEIHFGIYDKEKLGIGGSRLTGLGNAPYVFSAVIQMVKIFIEKRHPKTILLKSALYQPKRSKLYKAMAERIGKSLGYTVKSESEERPSRFKRGLKVLRLERE
jgi:hypothetical protein